jgi:hypothetical protein
MSLSACSFAVEPVDAPIDAAVDMSVADRSPEDLSMPDLTSVDLECSPSCSGVVCGQANACGKMCCAGSGCTPIACDPQCQAANSCGSGCTSLADDTMCSSGGNPGVCVSAHCVATATYSVFDDTGSGVLQGAFDSIELGMKFTSDLAGRVTAIRFYKAAGVTGPHVAHFWNGTGTLLATANFTSETASGWQEVALPSPVPIAASTTYVVSYSEHGGFAWTIDYFDTARDVPPLHVPIAGGIFVLSEGAFPTMTYNNSNYWVDAVVTVP